MSGNFKGKGWGGVIAVLPASLWLAFFLVIPFLLILGISFLSRGEYGEIERPWTLENYKRFLGFGELGYEPLYLIILGKSCALAVVTAFLCALFGLPLAFFIGSLRGGARAFALTLLVIPVWTNLLIRTFAWQILLGPGGMVTGLARGFGLLGAGEALYPGNLAVLIGLVCDYLPFAALPLFASVEKIDWTLSDAARDLGASGWTLFRHAILPQIRAGLLAGILLVFLPATGQFVIPDLLGGAKTTLLGNVLQQQFGVSRDWPFGGAFTVVSIGMVMASIWFYFSVLNKGKEGT